MLAKLDENRRKFLKHLAILGVGGVAGMSIAEFTSPTEADIVDEYVDKEISTGRKAIYHYIDEDLEPEEMTQEFVSGGFPIVNEVVCAYHEDMQELVILFHNKLLLPGSYLWIPENQKSYLCFLLCCCKAKVRMFRSI